MDDHHSADRPNQHPPATTGQPASSPRLPSTRRPQRTRRLLASVAWPPAASHGGGRCRRAGPAAGWAGLGRRAARTRPGVGRRGGRVRAHQSRPPLAGDRIALVAVGLAGALNLPGAAVLGGSGPARLRPGWASPGSARPRPGPGGTGVWAAWRSGARPRPVRRPTTRVPFPRSATATERERAATRAARRRPTTPMARTSPSGRGPTERAKAEAVWKASAANAEQWRDPDAAAAAGFRFKDKDEAGRSAASVSCTCPTRPGGPRAGARPAFPTSSTGTDQATG